MSYATLIRTVAFASVLCCAQALAIIPPALTIRFGGAEPVGPYHRAMHEGAEMTLAVAAEPGSLIWVYAVALDAQGEPDETFALSLLFDPSSSRGSLSGTFVVPHGMAGRSFQIAAIAISLKGDTYQSSTYRLDILRQADVRHLAASVLDE